jgi:hypothetical protein
MAYQFSGRGACDTPTVGDIVRKSLNPPAAASPPHLQGYRELNPFIQKSWQQAALLTEPSKQSAPAGGARPQPHGVQNAGEKPRQLREWARTSPVAGGQRELPKTKRNTAGADYGETSTPVRFTKGPSPLSRRPQGRAGICPPRASIFSTLILFFARVPSTRTLWPANAPALS